MDKLLDMVSCARRKSSSGGGGEATSRGRAEEREVLGSKGRSVGGVLYLAAALRKAAAPNQPPHATS